MKKIEFEIVKLNNIDVITTSACNMQTHFAFDGEDYYELNYYEEYKSWIHNMAPISNPPDKMKSQVKDLAGYELLSKDTMNYTNIYCYQNGEYHICNNKHTVTAY